MCRLCVDALLPPIHITELLELAECRHSLTFVLPWVVELLAMADPATVRAIPCVRPFSCSARVW